MHSTARSIFTLMAAACISAGSISGCQNPEAAEPTATVTTLADKTNWRIPIDLSTLQEDPLTDMIPPDSEDPHFFFVTEGTRGDCYKARGNVVCSMDHSSLLEEAPIPLPQDERPTRPVAGINADGWTITGDYFHPLASYELRTGHYVDFGDVICAKPDDRQMICETPKAQFALIGQQHDFRGSGPEVPYALETELVSPIPVRDGDDSEIVHGVTICRLDDGRSAMLTLGETSCRWISETLHYHEQLAQELARKNELAPFYMTYTDDVWCNWPSEEDLRKGLRDKVLCETFDESVVFLVGNEP